MRGSEIDISEKKFSNSFEEEVGRESFLGQM